MRGSLSSTTFSKDSEQGNKDDECHAFECNYKATDKIDIDCGTYGTLTIFVCKKCIGKFRIGGR